MSATKTYCPCCERMEVNDDKTCNECDSVIFDTVDYAREQGYTFYLRMYMLDRLPKEECDTGVNIVLKLLPTTKVMLLLVARPYASDVYRAVKRHINQGEDKSYDTQLDVGIDYLDTIWEF